MKYRFNIVLLTLVIVACSPEDDEARLARMHLPSPNYVADVNRGAALFRSRCTDCHGTTARGSNMGPPLIDSIYNPNHHADLAFHWAMRDGVKQHHWNYGDMPPQKNISPEQASDIIAWVRFQQRAHGIK